MHRRIAALALLPLAAACSDSTGANEPGQVAIRFATSTTTASSVRFSHAGSDALDLGNGVVISDIRLIVSKFKLERAEDACVEGQDDDDCEEFEAQPYLLDLPLGSGAVEVTNGLIPEGTYTKFEFEVEDIDLEDDEEEEDGEEAAAIDAIRTTLAGIYPGFPKDASMVVHGTANGKEFTVYFEAEIEVENELSPALTIPGATGLTVNLDPASWFQGIDLPARDGQLISEDEFGELKFKSGVRKVEAGDRGKKD